MRSGAVGVDFGTTNSALAVAEPGAPPRLATFDGTPSFRSLLYLERDPDARSLQAIAGPAAIEAYLQAQEPGRLIQSLKTFLAARHFSTTNVLGHTYRLEGLIEIILRQLREKAETQLGPLGHSVVAGRPVNFAGARDPEDEDLALRRLEAAYHNAGFTEVTFEYEPVAAAYHYERRLERDELILIADFGGGTSDFSLLRVGPSFRNRSRRTDSVLGTDGVAVAGDAFDARLVRHAIAPLLGRGATYKSIFGRVLSIPNWIYSHVERWHHLSFLKSRSTMQILLDLRREAFEPEKLDALLHLVRGDLGFHLYQAVERAKVALSAGGAGRITYRDGPLDLDCPVERGDFEAWIVDDLEALAGCVDGLLGRVGLAPGDVDRVFMTGGSSFVPAVRGIFTKRFGGEKIRAGDELTSVASGLALRALESGELQG